jgi:hypothetical protein
VAHGIHASGVQITGIDVRLPGLRAHGRHRRTRPRPGGMVKTLITVTCAAMFLVLPSSGWTGRADSVTRHVTSARTAHSALWDYSRVLREWQR